jgi:predicted DNA-binding transcriptional regulator AlpA
MLYLTPKTLPGFDDLWRGIGKPHPTSLAAALGVDVRTVYRWMATDQAPRPAALALFWLTPWGLSLIDADQQNRLTNATGQAAALCRDLAHMSDQLTRAQRMAEHHARHDQAANDPPYSAALTSAANTRPACTSYPPT